MRCLYCTFWNPVTPTRENGPITPSPFYIHNLRRRGCRVGCTVIPFCSLKLNTEIIAKTHPGAFPQTRTTCIQKGGKFRERSDSWFTCMLCLNVKDDKINTILKKQLAVFMAHDHSYNSGSVNVHLQEKTKKARTHYYSW